MADLGLLGFFLLAVELLLDVVEARLDSGVVDGVGAVRSRNHAPDEEDHLNVAVHGDEVAYIVHEQVKNAVHDPVLEPLVDGTTLLLEGNERHVSRPEESNPVTDQSAEDVEHEEDEDQQGDGGAYNLAFVLLILGLDDIELRDGVEEGLVVLVVLLQNIARGVTC